MKTATALSLVAFLSVTSGCIQPEKTTFAQTAQLSDTIRFTELTVSGNIVTLKISREDRGLVTTRAGATEASDFPEYATFQKTGTGLTTIASQTHLFIPITKPACVDAACNAFTFTMTRPGGTLGDVANLKVTRVPKLTCKSEIREVNGVYTDTDPVFSGATVTTVINGQTEGSPSGFYAKSTYVLTNGYQRNVALRGFLGTGTEIWLDEIDSTVGNDGRVVRVATSARTFDSEGLSAGSNTISIFGGDREGRRIQVGCTY